MRDQSKTWLDVLTDGQLFRDWFSLFGHFFLGAGYWLVIIAGFVFALATSVILIGIPMLLFMLASTRMLAGMDQQLVGALLNVKTAEVSNDIDTQGANLGERLGMYLGSWTTWRSLAYLALKLPLGAVALAIAIASLPLLAFELLFLGPLIAPSRPITVQLLHWLALGFHRIPAFLLPTGKRKRDVSRLETTDVIIEPHYELDDDGELVMRRRA